MKVISRGMPLLVALLCTTANAQELRVGPPTMKSLQVEYSHVFTVKPYEGKPVFTAQQVGTLPAQSPERELLSYFATMGRGEVERALKYWTTASQSMIRAQNARITPQELQSSVRGMFEGVSYQLVQRIDYGRFVLVEVQFTSATGKPGLLETYALEQQGGRWLLTQALADDPVMCCWNNPTGRVQRVAQPGGDLAKVLQTMGCKEDGVSKR
jgi:hypothetical protein